MDANAFAGRGFAAGGASPNGAAAGGGAAGNAQRRSAPHRPLTIKQLQGATQAGEGAMVIDGREIGQVSIVGRVVNYEAPSASATVAKSHTYTVSDGTGIISVKHWIETEASADADKALEVGAIVRANGTIKSLQGKLVLAGALRELKDNAEVSYHFLDAILTHQRLTKGHRNPSGAASASAATAAPTSTFGTGVNVENVPINDAILRVVKQAGSTGLTQDDVGRACQGRFTGAEVRDCIRTMIREGTIFTGDGGRLCA